jgi:quaternary ammonium compound-resistance protein SugE
MAWLLLLLASGLEIAWAVGLKFTEGFTRLWPSVFVVTGIVVSFFLAARVVRDIPIGTAYGVFVGIGAAGTGLVGILLFDEPARLMRIMSLVAIVLGVVGLKFFGDTEGPTDNQKSVSNGREATR